MKFKLFFCLISCSLLFFTSCSDIAENKNNTNTFASEQVIKQEQNYSIIKDENNRYKYTINNNDGYIVYQESTGFHYPNIDLLNGNIIDIHIGYGTGIIYHKYYDIEQDVFSINYNNVITSNKKMIAFLKNSNDSSRYFDRLVISDIFDKSKFYKEYELDFSKVDIPIVSASFDESNKNLDILYLHGDNQEKTSYTINIY